MKLISAHTTTAPGGWVSVPSGHYALSSRLVGGAAVLRFEFRHNVREPGAVLLNAAGTALEHSASVLGTVYLPTGQIRVTPQSNTSNVTCRLEPIVTQNSDLVQALGDLGATYMQPANVGEYVNAAGDRYFRP